jgi:hypothetical protein
MVTYNYDFVCTYHLMMDDPEMANFLYQVQLTTAFCMERHLFSMMCDPNPATNLFDSTRVQTVFNYLVHEMKLHENPKFVQVVKTHPLVQLYKREKSEDRDVDDAQFVSESLLWLISFHSFHAFHACMIDVFTNGGAQCITDEHLDALKKTFEDFDS